MTASSFPGLWTMKIRLYRRNMTAAAAMMVKVMVTPRTAAGSACPERPIAASVGFRVVVRPSNVGRCRCQLLMRQQGGCLASSPGSVRAALGVGVLAGNKVAQGVRAFTWKRCRVPVNCLADVMLCHRDCGGSPRGAVRHEREKCSSEDGFGLPLASERSVCTRTNLPPIFRADLSKAAATRVLNGQLQTAHLRDCA
jgi:hypothetical protein